jgi:hypothetical protein
MGVGKNELVIGFTNAQINRSKFNEFGEEKFILVSLGKSHVG